MDKIKQNVKLWEILVPRFTNEKVEYPVEHHQILDEKVRGISGGITILKPAKGQWINPKGKMFEDEMIPVRILCSEEHIEQIIEFVLKHYPDQEAILIYAVSDDVRLIYRDFVESKN